MKANTATNFVCALIAGGAMAVFNFFVVSVKYSDKWVGALCSGLFLGGSAFVLCFAALQIATSAYRKKQQKLEEEAEEQD